MSNKVVILSDSTCDLGEDLLKKYKEYEPKHDTYKFIESVDEVDGLFVIPELQTKIEEQPMVKKLIPNTRKDD